MLRNVSVIIKRGAIKSRSLSTTNVNSQSSALDGNVRNTKPPGWDEALPFEEIPGPKPVPLLGNTWRLILSQIKGEDFIDMLKS